MMGNTNRLAVRLMVLLVGAVGTVSASAAETAAASSSASTGKIGLTAKESVPDWPEPVKAPPNAPNIVLILLDDIGFADTSTFGGVAQTPQLTQLAEHGVRFNNFNVTGMCSPTRAALLSGRNHHRVGFGIISDWAGGFPGYNSVWKKSTASIAEVLRQSGYSTSAFGKWHNTPDWEITPAGPFDRWPTGLGFDYFYGFMGPSGGENQWEPVRLYRNTIPVDPATTPEQGYHLTADVTDEAIRWVQTHVSLAPDKPYFLYFAPGAVHFPHHVPREWIDKYRGRFNGGWDQLNQDSFSRQGQMGVVPPGTKLTARPKEIPAWSSLSRDQRRLYARQMEIYAGFIGHTDAEIGRLLKTVQSLPGGDNTLIVYVAGDNGASGMHGLNGMPGSLQEQLQHIDELGGPEVPDNMYSMGWGWAGNTPFQWWKMYASHFGSTRAPLVVSWPARLRPSGVMRSQFTHVTDVAPTLFEAAGVGLPSTVGGVLQQPLDGVSFMPLLLDAHAASAHRTQYFEIMGNRSIYQNGWVAAARHQPALDWYSGHGEDYLRDRWELYHVAEDFSEARDLAARYPRRLRELQTLFDLEARKNDVYPLGAAFGAGKPSLTEGKRELTFVGMQRIPGAHLPAFMSGSHRIGVGVVVPEEGAQGVLATYGDRMSGFTLFVEEGHLIYESRTMRGRQSFTSRSTVPRGPVKLTFEFLDSGASAERGGPRKGIGRLYIDDALAGEFELILKSPSRDAALFIGRAAVSPGAHVSGMASRSTFTGVVHQTRVELK